MKTLQVTNVYRTAGEVVAKAKGDLILFGGINALFMAFLTLTEKTDNETVMLFSLFGLLVTTFIQFFFLIRIDHHVRDVSQPYQQSFRYTLRRFLPALWVSAVYGLGSAVGFLFFILPGLFVFTTFSQSAYFSFFEKKKVKEAFLASERLTRGKRIKIFLFFLPLFLISALVEIVRMSLPSTVVPLLMVFDGAVWFLQDVLWLVAMYSLWITLHHLKHAER